MRKRNLFAALLSLFILLQLFSSCETPSPVSSDGTESNENDATQTDESSNRETELSDVTLYGYANDWVDEAFLNENRVYYAFYPDESGESPETDAPRTRSFIITTEEEYRELCPHSPIDVDFAKEMIILYISPSVNYPSNAQKSTLDKATLCEGVLSVRIKEPSVEAWSLDTCPPYALCLALKAEKAEITEITFEGISMLYYKDLRSPFAGKTVHFCKYIYNVDDAADYIYVEFKEGGYVVFLRETLEMMEFSYMGVAPYSSSDARNYYGGPFNYLEKIDSVFVNMRTNQELDVSPEEAEAYAQRTRNSFLSKTEYRTNLSATKGNVAGELNSFFFSMDTQE